MPNFSSRTLVAALLKQYYADTDKDSKLTRTIGFKRSVPGSSSLFAVVPDQIYKPRIKVCIDFNHTYADVGEDDNLAKLLRTNTKKQRIIPFPTLQEIYKKIVKYNAVFFEYNKVFSSSLHIGSSTYDSLMQNITNETFVNEFLNKFINMFVTNVRTDRRINGIGTAVVSLRETSQNKGYKRASLLFDDSQPFDTQLFNPYLPITIFVSGRIYKNYMFPIFSGFLFQINPKNSNGFKSLELNCADMLKLMEYSYENVSPALIQLAELKKNETYNIYSTPFYGVQHLKIFKSIFNGGKILYGEDIEESNLTTSQLQTKSSAEGTVTFSNLGFRFVERSDENKFINEEKLDDLPTYLENMHADVMSSLLKTTSYDSKPRCLIYWGDQLTPYRIFNVNTQQIYSSEFSSRLQILQETAARVYYNFYMDVYGNACYHPYRLSNNFLEYFCISINRSKFSMRQHLFKNCLIIPPEEITDISDMINVDNISTVLILKGIADVANTGASELQNLYGTAVDLKNLRRYGYKRKEVQDDLANQNPEINDSSGKKLKYMDVLAKERLRHDNAEAYTRSVNIILRPELELALPIYFEDSDDVFYIQAISHSINVNEVSTTTVTCNFGRKYKQLPPDMFSFIVTSENLYKTKNTDSISYSEVKDSYQAELDNFYIPSEAADVAVTNNAYYLQSGYAEGSRAQTAKQEEKNARAKSKRAVNNPTVSAATKDKQLQKCETDNVSPEAKSVRDYLTDGIIEKP